MSVPLETLSETNTAHCQKGPHPRLEKLEKLLQLLQFLHAAVLFLINKIPCSLIG